jgi:hypothetical protein
MPSCSKSFKWLQTTQLARKQWRRRDENGSGRQQLLFAGVSVCLCHAPADVCKTGEAIEVRDSSRFSIDWISPGFLMCVLVCVASAFKSAAAR